MEKRMSDTMDRRVEDLEDEVQEHLTRVEELEDEVQVLKGENEEMRDDIYDIKQFLITSSIGQEQLWSVVFEDILKQPVPTGEPLDSMARKIFRRDNEILR
jgi:TolA-binding protein